MKKRKSTIPPSETGNTAAREQAAQQLKESETTAKEVADLCAQAAESARRHKLPHAGVGSSASEDA